MVKSDAYNNENNRNNWDRLLRAVSDIAVIYNGSIEGDTAQGELDISFPNLLQAARFISICKWEKNTRLTFTVNRSTPITFTDVVAVTVSNWEQLAENLFSRSDNHEEMYENPYNGINPPWYRQPHWYK